jgi:ABC-2 type transport system permease protein
VNTPIARSGWRIAAVLCRREVLRFLRQPAQIGAALGTPVLLWLFLGSGFTSSFRPAGLGETSYAAFLLPGMTALVAVFTAIFSSISIIEDRQEGWLQSVLVSPAPRWSIALGKTAGGSLIAWVQAAMLLPAAPLLGTPLTVGAVLVILLALALTSFAMTALGVACAWRSETSGGFHAVMNLVFMPMWLLSGAFFPPEGASVWLGWIMRVNPLTWCVEAIRSPMFGRVPPWSLLGAALFATAMIAVATAIVSRRSRSGA